MERYILEIPNLVPKVFCDHLIKKFENDPRKQRGGIGPVNAKVVNENLKKSVDLHISSLSGWEKEDQILYKYIKKAIKKYISALKDNFKDKNNDSMFDDILSSNFYDSGFDIQRVDRGPGYSWHHDSPITIPGRVANIILYLNTLEPEEGGATELITGHKIRPEAGKILLFPCSWTFAHCGNEVKAPHKYISCSLLHIKHD